MQNALRLDPIGQWTDELRRRKTVFQNQSETYTRNDLTTKVMNWDTISANDDNNGTSLKRRRGPPRQKWI